MDKKYDYYLGLDLGSSSVGWAITNPKYELCKFHGKSLWGVNKFEEGKTAEERRLHRSTRRRNMRVKERIRLLQELFSDEISKIDPEFFMRLKESKYHAVDKDVDAISVLFNDEHFKDADYYSKYPTIYHLRKDLIDSSEKKDLRLIYIAIHNILKYRGHFLFEGQDFQSATDFSEVFHSLRNYLYDNKGLDLPLEIEKDMESVLRDHTLNLTRRKNALQNLIKPYSEKNEETLWKDLMATIAGSSVQISKLFPELELDEEDGKTKVNFSKDVYEEKREEYESFLHESVQLLDHLRAVYDWMILSETLNGREYLSDAKVEEYNEHARDLETLKYLIKKYGTQKDYNVAFRSTDVKNNYASYVGSNITNNEKTSLTKCNQEDVNKFFEKLLKDYSVEDKDRTDYLHIMEKLGSGNRSALKKLRTTDNRVIPYQVHLHELETILQNAQKHYPFLSEKDEQGLTPIEKIKKIHTFRIPYYVGPLNPYHSKENGGNGNAWIVKKKDEKVLPWNFDEVVDREASAERFIRRMTLNCTYLIGEDVVPKDSLLYSEFTLLNELNNLSLNGKRLDPELKMDLVNNLFKKKQKVTKKSLLSHLKRRGVEVVSLSGLDQNTFKSSLTSYIKFHNIFGDKIDFEPTRSMVEHIILWRCLYGEDNQIFLNRIKNEYPDITEEQLKQISKLKFSGWGRLSEKFLTGIPGVDTSTGEIYDSLMDALRKTSNNLMELLSSKYTFKNNIEKENSLDDTPPAITYDALLGEATLSPAVKKTVWKTIKITEELRKIMGQPPTRIFLEMTRSNDFEKKRTVSRKDQLLALYKACKEDVDDLYKELNETDPDQLRAKKLYLYYLQQGRCMYSGKRIDLKTLLLERNSDGTTYDIDHIYPRSLTKDDSFDNLVLVDKRLNSHKSNNYPIEAEIRKARLPFWKQLKQNGFLTERKYARLVRKEELTAEELAGFINRQLVETSQATKATADILKRIYPDSELVYVKARPVSDFRYDFGFYKNRDLNLHHHAEDAYLNIVVGNAYHTKFTANPYNYIRRKKENAKPYNYNLARFFDWKIERNSVVAWDPKTTIETVKDTMNRNDVSVVVSPAIRTGQLFDLTLIPKSNKTWPDMAPLKMEDRLEDISKYGGYKSLKASYYMVVEHQKSKKKRIRTIEPVFIQFEKELDTKDDWLSYCKDILKLEDPKIIKKRIPMQSTLIYDGLPVLFRSRTGSNLVFENAEQVILSNKLRLVFKSMSSKALSEYCTDENLIRLYKEYRRQLNYGRFKGRGNTVEKIVKDGLETFKTLNLEDKIDVLKNINDLFGSKSSTGVDLSKIGGAKRSGMFSVSKNITDHNVVLLHKSPTGMFVKEEVLNEK